MRYVFLILFALVLAAPFALRKAILHDDGSSTHASTAAERLVIITPHNSDIRNEFSRAFSQWHRAHYESDVEIDFRVPGGTNDIQKQLEATYGAWLQNKQTPPPEDFTVVWGGGDYFFNQLKGEHILQPLNMPPALLQEFRDSFPQPSLAGVKLYDNTAAADGTPTPQWIGVCLSSFGICYNPDVYHALEIPEPTPERGWSALTDPRLFGYIALADPAHSASASVGYLMVIQHKMAEAEASLLIKRPDLRAMPKKELAKNDDYRQALETGWQAGMAELVKIAANARYFTDSSTLVPMDVSRGETAAGIAIDFYAQVTEESVGSGRMQYIAPIGATAITPDPVAVLAGACGRKLELAQHFIEFLLSPQGQRLWILKPGTPVGPLERSLRRPPIRLDVYSDRTGWVDDTNPFSSAAGFNERGEWMALFDDTRPMWVAAWIDSREELQDAYRKILAARVNRRAALIDTLADLPIKMADVQAMKAEAATVPDISYWRAKKQIEWAEKFRQHYRAVGEEAE